MHNEALSLFLFTHTTPLLHTASHRRLHHFRPLANSTFFLSISSTSSLPETASPSSSPEETTESTLETTGRVPSGFARVMEGTVSASEGRGKAIGIRVLCVGIRGFVPNPGKKNGWCGRRGGVVGVLAGVQQCVRVRFGIGSAWWLIGGGAADG
ncbi:hypothetical protein Droror1_Dr00015179 [Drosera rotundifolia]